MTSMYKGTKKFDRDQLFFVVEAILCSAFDRVESCLPPTTPKSDRLLRDSSNQLESYQRGAVECAGMALAVLYAQLTDDGIGIGDALDLAGDFPKAVEKFVKDCLKGKGRELHPGDKCSPDARPYAEAFVDNAFCDYLYLGVGDAIDSAT